MGWQGFAAHDPEGDHCGGKGARGHDVGLTGLCLLAFVGAGHVPAPPEGLEEVSYAHRAERALRYLIGAQREDGLIGDAGIQQHIYGHAIATMALCNALRVTKDTACRAAAERAADYLRTARNVASAWRYEARGGESDTSVTVWCVLALRAATLAGISVGDQAFESSRAWITKMTEPEFGQVGYNMPGGTSCRLEGLQERFPPEQTRALTAAGMLVRVNAGEDPRTSGALKKGAALCLDRLPDWNPDTGTIDHYYWFFGTEAMWQMGGTHWRKWDESMKSAIVDHQHPAGSGARAGSWDPIDPWGGVGGRVYSTALLLDRKGGSRFAAAPLRRAARA